MKTYGSHESIPVRGKYPARCSICGVVWQAKDLRRGEDGFYRCPDDREQGGQALDRMNNAAARQFRGVVDTRRAGDPPVSKT